MKTFEYKDLYTMTIEVDPNERELYTDVEVKTHNDAIYLWFGYSPKLKAVKVNMNSGHVTPMTPNGIKQRIEQLNNALQAVEYFTGILNALGYDVVSE